MSLRTDCLVFCSIVLSLTSCGGPTGAESIEERWAAIVDPPFVTGAVARRQAPTAIPALFMGWHEVQRTARLIAAGKEPWASEWQSIQTEANAALVRTPHPFSRDPDMHHYDAVEFLDRWMEVGGPFNGVGDGDDLWSLAHAWIFTGDSAYCAAGARTLRAWAQSTLFSIDAFTSPERHNIGLLVAMQQTHAAHAYELLSGCLSDDDRGLIKGWLERGKEIVLESHADAYWKTNVDDEFNNHLSFHNVYLAMYGFLADKPELVTYAIGAPTRPPSCTLREHHSKTCNIWDWKTMVQGAIFNGSEPVPDMWGSGGVPLARGQIWDRYRHFADHPGGPFKLSGFHYSNYHVWALSLVAEVAYHRGYSEDLYRWTAWSGENLSMAYLPLARMLRDTNDGGYIQNEYSRHVVGLVGHDPGDVKMYYDDDQGTRGNWLGTSTTEPRRSIAYPAGRHASDVAGYACIGPSSSDNVATYFADGKMVTGNWVNLGTTLSPYATDVGYRAGDIVGIQGGSTADVKAYYRGAGAPVGSRGNMTNLASRESLRPITYPAGYGPDDVAGSAADDTSDDVFTYFKDGRVSRGTWVELASILAPQPYEIDDYYKDDIDGNQLFWGERAGNAYREWLEAPLARWGGADYELARATCAFKFDRPRRYDPGFRIMTAFENGITYDDIGWEFDYGSTDGWTPGPNGQATFTREDGALLVTSSGSDPQMISPPIRIFPHAALAAAKGWQSSTAGTGADERCKAGNVEQLVYTKVAIELSAPTGLLNNGVSLFWENDGTGFNATNAVNINVAVGSAPHTVVIDLANNAAWTVREITRLRVDPLSVASRVRVHSIRLRR